MSHTYRLAIYNGKYKFDIDDSFIYSSFESFDKNKETIKIYKVIRFINGDEDKICIEKLDNENKYEIRSEYINFIEEDWELVDKEYGW